MTATVFVDTNIFVYARDASERIRQPRAADWLRRLWLEQTGRTSIQVLSEYYATVTRKLDPGLDPDTAWADVNALLAWEPQQLDGDLLTRGRDIERRFRLSWWDALIVAAAQVQGCAILLSEDFQSGMEFGGTVVVNPFDMNVAEAKATFAVTAPRPQSRHRARGRPARAAS